MRFCHTPVHLVESVRSHNLYMRVEEWLACIANNWMLSTGIITKHTHKNKCAMLNFHVTGRFFLHAGKCMLHAACWPARDSHTKMTLKWAYDDPLWQTQYLKVEKAYFICGYQKLPKCQIKPNEVYSMLHFTSFVVKSHISKQSHTQSAVSN